MENQIMDIFRFFTLFMILTIKQIQNISFMDIFHFVIPTFMILWIVTYHMLKKAPFCDSYFYHLVNLSLAIVVFVGYSYYIIFLIYNKNFSLVPISLLLTYRWYEFTLLSLKRYKDFNKRNKSWHKSEPLIRLAFTIFLAELFSWSLHWNWIQCSHCITCWR